MEKLSKIKLNQFGKEELEKRRMNALLGGGNDGDCNDHDVLDCTDCACVCWGDLAPVAGSSGPTTGNTASSTPLKI